jgi:hypothetical protein
MMRRIEMKQIGGTHAQRLPSLLCRLGIALMAIAWATVSMAQSSETTTQITGSVCGKWTVVKSPDGPSSNNHLYGVSASAANNVWAVGSYQSGNPINGPFKTLTERWNGTAWRFIPSADDGAEDALGGVAAISPTDVWAVGDFMPQLTSPQTAIIEHWNGQKWSVVPSPRPGQLSGLSSVRAVSANDVWAVGLYYDNAGNSQTLIEHWNGKKWRIVPSPSPGLTDNILGGLTVVSAKDIWAAGAQSSDQANTLQTLIERWDGKTWSVVPSPSPAPLYNSLGGMTAISATDVWAVGVVEGSNFVQSTLAEHWDGISWMVVPTPDVGSFGNSLSDVSALGGTDVWAVGSYYITPELTRTLIQRWDGKRWSVVPSPNPSKEFNQLASVTQVSNTLWSVGYFGTSNAAHTLVESLCH